jgi:hypothetical protein
MDGIRMAVLIAKYCICIACVGVGEMTVNIRTLEIWTHEHNAGQVHSSPHDQSLFSLVSKEAT